MSNPFSFELFDKMPVIGIMRNIPDECVKPIAEIYTRSGLACLEITMNSSNAKNHIATLAGKYSGRLNIGAGTVCSMRDLEKAIAAGAQFIVTPVINEEVIKTCVDAKIPIFPGAYTPSEIYKAWSMGATMVKLFPAGELKPASIKEILAPLNFVSLMPTGGVTLENFTEYFSAGAKAVGIGSHLFPKDVIARKDWIALAEIYKTFVKIYHDFESANRDN